MLISTKIGDIVLSLSYHVETLALLRKKDINNHIEIKLEVDKEDVIKVESKRTCENIKKYNTDLRFQRSIYISN